MPTACNNCASPLSGEYCSQCGQKSTQEEYDLKQLLVDTRFQIFPRASFVRNLVALLFRPGHLTWLFSQGSRIQVMNPIRLYLATVALCFVLDAWLTPLGELSSEMRSNFPNVPAATVDACVQYGWQAAKLTSYITHMAMGGAYALAIRRIARAYHPPKVWPWVFSIHLMALVPLFEFVFSVIVDNLLIVEGLAGTIGCIYTFLAFRKSLSLRWSEAGYLAATGALVLIPLLFLGFLVRAIALTVALLPLLILEIT